MRKVYKSTAADASVYLIRHEARALAEIEDSKKLKQMHLNAILKATEVIANELEKRL